MTKPTGLVLPPPIAEPTFVETVPFNTASVATWPLSNQAIGVLLPKRWSPLTISRLGVLIGTASGNIDLGLYTWDGSQFVRVIASGSTAAAGSTAMQYITLSTAYRYDGRTDVWAFCAADNTTVTIGRVAGTGVVTAIGNRVASKTSSFALPATIASASATGTQPYIYAGA